MSDYILTVVDTAGIQKYIFGSNKLTHHIGASQLVYDATRTWVYQILSQLGATNIEPNGDFKANARIEDGTLTSELIYAGGGKALIIFTKETQAKTFARRLTRQALQIAPGLQLTVTHLPFNWSAPTTLPQKITAIFKQLARKKAHPHPPSQLFGLGVTADCQYTGLPAVQLEDDEHQRRISAETAAKTSKPVARLARERLQAVWPAEIIDNFSFPYRADYFGREVHKSSYLAIVHIDGNAIGNRIQRLKKASQNNRDYINRLRQFSNQLKEKSAQSLQNTVSLLVETIQETDTITLFQDAEENNPILPFRPLVFGGDDLTFVCEGRLGLSLAAAYMEDFSQHQFIDGGNTSSPITTRAGIAIVKTHYPFARAYELAEALANNTKTYLNQEDADRTNLSVMDWHFAVGGTILDLKTIRKREYTTEDGDLTMRPVRVVGDNEDWTTWQNFTKVVTEFTTCEAWKDRRNKVKALRESLRDGPASVKSFLHNYNEGKRLPNISDNKPHLAETGWADKRCGYFDAIEAMDFFIPLLSQTPTKEVNR